MPGPPLEDVDPRPGRRKRKTTKRTKAARTEDGGGPAGKSRRSLLGRVLRICVAVAALGLIAGVSTVAGLFMVYGNDPQLPSLAELGDYRPEQVVRILDRGGAVIGEIGGTKRTVVPYAQIPKLLVDAVVSAEDAGFFHHAGLDYRGMFRAFVENVMRGRVAQGGSTITQQVVKRILLSPYGRAERTMRRKVQEIILARELERRYSKEEILALYLNNIYYGHGRYGCEEAARYFFGKSVKDVDLAEAALLAGIPQSPDRLSPRRHADAAKTRQRYVLGQMAEQGVVTRAAAEKVAAEPIRLVKDAFPSLGVAPELHDVVSKALRERMGEAKAVEQGVVVRTTIDADLETLAREALEKGLEDIDARQGFRGPGGHLAGKALDKHRKDLAAAHKDGVKDSEIVEGILDVVEKDTTGKDPHAGRLVVDLGGTRGVVDLGAEPRYAAGPKPLPDRFAPDDIVRVRLAPERSSVGDGPALALELGPQGAMVVMNPQTREVMALVGGYGYRPGGFDRAQRARRQAGSAWKPFVYAPALDSGKFTAASLVNDAPEVYELWKPQNYEKEEFRGPVRLRDALSHSINTVAIRLLDHIGIPAGREAAVKIGITTPIPDDIGLSMALGAATVSPLEMANAYSTFAAGGQRAEPILLRAIGDSEVRPAAPPQRALRPEVAYILTSMMRSVVEEGTAKASVGTKLRRPVAGKTGTSNGQRDAWFVGYTPDLLAAVWVGFDDMRRLGKGEVGGRAAAPIWADFMGKALKDKPVRDFVQPPGIVVARIDRATGLLAAPGADGLDEVFLDGTAPTESAAPAGEEQSADKLLLDR